MSEPRVGGKFIKVLSAKKTKERELSKPLVTFLSCMQLIFGFNFGFVKSSGRFKTATCFMTIASGCVMTLILILSFTIKVIGNLFYIVNIVQYIPFFIILICGKHTVYDFLINLPNGAEPTRQCKNAEILLVLCAALMFGAKCATAAVYCSLTLCTDSHWIITDMALHAPMIALDIIPIINFIVFYHVYACARDIVVRYEHREINLKHLQNSYKEVLDNFAKFRCNYDAIFVWWFLTESIKWMLIIWNQLTLIKSSCSWWLHGCSITWALLDTMQICVPAVFAEMISMQTDAMKIILHDRLLVEMDEIEKSGLLRLLRYMEARPLLRKAWRLVPVDLQLPVTMLSICTTYLIVIIQLTHLFD